MSKPRFILKLTESVLISVINFEGSSPESYVFIKGNLVLVVISNIYHFYTGLFNIGRSVKPSEIMLNIRYPKAVMIKEMFD